ncbi:p48 polypeptide of DNA primase [Pleosporales sp. CAS-2024a]
MPHSVTPDAMSADESSRPASQADNIKSEPGPQDVAMDEAPSTAGAEKAKVSLEALFDDGDSDDEFASSAPGVKSEEEEASQPAPLNISSRSSFSDPEIMRAFYQRLFPFRPLFHWLNHAAVPTPAFAHREFAFTLPNDAYLRYQSFATADMLRKQCIQMLPSRFEIGPQYSTNPRDRKTLRKASAFRPIMKELVFDIDMTDYDDIRTCCTGASICHKCWGFITMAIKVIDVALREDFGFKHVLWVYSGRRGAHAWVCDKRARELDDQKRRSIAGYMELLKGGDNSGKRVNLRRPLHPHVERSLNLLKEHFQTCILADQDPWAADDKASHLVGLLPDPQLRAALQKKWDSSPHRPSASKWADIDALAKSGALAKSPKELQEAKQDIVLEYTYPRLDAEVSKKLNHLLKSPFVVHPGTGRVCVPIDTRIVEEFDPLSVPTVTQLLTEIDEWSGNEGEKKVQDWEKTSLKPYVDYFRRFVAGLMADDRPLVKRERDEGADAMEF